MSREGYHDLRDGCEGGPLYGCSYFVYVQRVRNISVSVPSSSSL